MILETIDNINALIADQLFTTKKQIEAIGTVFYDQKDAATNIKLDTGKLFSMDSKMLFQSIHLADGHVVANRQTFGSGTDSVYDVRFILVAMSTKKKSLSVVMQALQETSYVVIDGVENDTNTVLTRYLRVRANQDKNYDPKLEAIAVRYHIEGVCDEDLEELHELSTTYENEVVSSDTPVE